MGRGKGGSALSNKVKDGLGVNESTQLSPNACQTQLTFVVMVMQCMTKITSITENGFPVLKGSKCLKLLLLRKGQNHGTHPVDAFYFAILS